MKFFRNFPVLEEGFFLPPKKKASAYFNDVPAKFDVYL